MTETEVKRLLHQDSEAFKAGVEVGKKEICDKLRGLKWGYENELDTDHGYEKHIQLCAKISLAEKIICELEKE